MEHVLVADDVLSIGKFQTKETVANFFLSKRTIKRSINRAIISIINN